MEENTRYDQSVENNYPEVQPQHGLATASLVCGIIGLVCCSPLSIAALIFAIIAKKDGNTEGITTAGLVLGIIGVCFLVLIIIYVILGILYLGTDSLNSMQNL